MPKSIEKGFPDAKTPIQTYKVISGKQIKIPDLSSIFLIKFPTENSVEQVISELKKLSEVEYAHPNHIIKAFITFSIGSFPSPTGIFSHAGT